MYENTEYLKTVSESVRGSLYEMEALMSGASATEVEFQVQKWMGSLFSVGMSQEAVNAITGAFGKVAAGQIEGLTEGGAGSLLVMAANDAGVPIADVLTDGIDSSETNSLLQAAVNYLADLYESSKDNQVVQQQLAKVFGVKASDLKAATNLAESVSVISNTDMTYVDMLDRLFTMAGSMGKRTSIGEKISNVLENGKYTLASSIASTPAMNVLYKMASMLKDTTGGIDFGLPLVMGNGMPITFNVADLMRTGALAGGIMSSMGAMFGGGGGLTGSSILNAIGVNSSAVKVNSRGTGLGLSTMSGITTSESGSMVGNSSSDDITSKTMTDQTDQSKSETASAVDESDEVKLSTVDTHILDILDVLRTIKDGGATLSVRVDNEVRLASVPGSGIY
jgi:hypothetical protein